MPGTISFILFFELGNPIQQFLFAKGKGRHIGHRNVGADSFFTANRIDMPVDSFLFAVFTDNRALKGNGWFCTGHGFF